MLTNISKKFGRKIIFDGLEFYLFPNAKELSSASINELTSCGLGYRAKFVKSVATEIESKMLNFEEIKRKHYFESRKELVKLKGIGNKTADCILLFAFEKLDAFPIDVWIYRSILENYYWLFEDIKKYHSNNKPTNNQYNIIGSRVREYFGEYAGYVQQYLYYHVRDTSRRTW
jgi:N-glycosylase/DNA lyase